MKPLPFKRPLFLLILLALAAGPCLAEEEEQEDEKTAEEIELEKKEILEKRLAEEQEIKAQFGYTFNDISDKLVTVTCDGDRGRSFGSGFVATLNGRTFLFTNQHVILGADTISFKAASGKTLRPRSVEFSASRDIARLLLPDGMDGFEITGEIEVDSLIGVFGNSDGGGVATELYGSVASVSSEVFEVSADFVSGNSGSPVLNLDQEAIGIATYVSYYTDDEVGNKSQRYCYRLAGNRWMPINWKKYNDKYGKSYRTHEALVDSILEITDLWFDSPDRRMTADDHPDADLREWSTEHNYVINRITRMRDQKTATQHELDNTNKQIKKNMNDSAKALSAVCRKRARQMRMLATQRELTSYLRNKFEDLADRLDYSAWRIDSFGEELSKINYFHFE